MTPLPFKGLILVGAIHIPIWIMNTFIRQRVAVTKQTDRQTDRIHTNVKTLVKTGYIRRKFIIDCLYSRELVTKN